MATPTRFPDAKRRSATLSRRRHGRRHQAARLALEPLEVRWLPSTTGVQLPPAETINLADNLGTLGAPVQASGSIGGGPQGAADVAWYHFQLGRASQVDLTVRTPAGDSPFASVLSLFNSDPNDAWNPYGDPNAYGDPYDPTGHRLMEQVQANPGTGTAQLVQDLSPGDYYVAISGAGNLDFSPVVAGSGFDGATGSYVLSASATDLGLSSSGPTMIASDPAAGATLNSSPLAIRVAMSGALDPNTLNLGQDVQLLSLPAGGGPASPVTLAGINFSAANDELQLFPQAPLAPGGYEVLLLGDPSGGGQVLAGPSGSNLGQDAQHPQGANESFTFQVNGVDGVAGATPSDSTTATAQQLGDITGAGLVRIAGAIGVDPSFNPGLSFDPMFPDPWNNPANQVDLYHFSVMGPGRFMLLADASAGLIGSPLDPGLSVWKLDPTTGQLDFVAGNNNTGNPIKGTDGSQPLYTDSALSAGLTAGDYYIAVANGSNTPSPLEYQPPGSPGVFDPNQPGSAQNGMTTGPYVLDLMVAPAPAAPTVVESAPFPGQALGSAPTRVTVQFSGPMDMQSLTFQSISPEVYILNANGTTYFPRLLNYDHTTNTATFQMLDGLPDGSYTLHLSGPTGLANLGGVPLVGNSRSGDYVVPFTVNGPDRGITGNPSQGYTIASQYGGNVAQQVGTLFPDELVAGVTIVRSPESSPAASSSPPEDRYAIQVLQNQQYAISFSGSNLPAGLHVAVVDASGRDAVVHRSFFGNSYLIPLAAGSYTIVVSGWPADQEASVSYDMTIQLFGGQDNAPPLTDGPAPAIQIALAGLTSTSSPSTGGVPSSTGGVTTVGFDPGGAVAGPLTSGTVAAPSGTTGGSNGGPGVEGTATVGTSAGSASISLVANEAASGLSGLGMSPLGGSGGAATAGTTGASSPATVQVALGAPGAGSPAFGRLALSLVTLTSVISTNHDGQEVLATDLPNPSVDTEENPTADAPQADGREENRTPAAAGIENDRLQGAPATVPGQPPASSGVQPSRGPAPVTPGTRPTPPGNVSNGPSVPAGAAGERAAVSGDAIAAPIADRPRAGSRAGLARMVIAGAIATAAFRGRSAIRGLHWRKGAFSTWWRLDGASPAEPHPARGSRGGRATAPTAGPTRCDSTIEMPGR